MASTSVSSGGWSNPSPTSLPVESSTRGTSGGRASNSLCASADRAPERAVRQLHLHEQELLFAVQQNDPDVVPLRWLYWKFGSTHGASSSRRPQTDRLAAWSISVPPAAEDENHDRCKTRSRTAGNRAFSARSRASSSSASGVISTMPPQSCQHRVDLCDHPPARHLAQVAQACASCVYFIYCI